MLLTTKKQQYLKFLFLQNLIKFNTFTTLKLLFLKLNGRNLKSYLYFCLNQKSKKFSYTIIKTNCILTGRTRSVYRFFKLSRIMIREYTAMNYFLGVTKSSW